MEKNSKFKDTESSGECACRNIGTIRYESPAFLGREAGRACDGNIMLGVLGGGGSEAGKRASEVMRAPALVDGEKGPGGRGAEYTFERVAGGADKIGWVAGCDQPRNSGQDAPEYAQPRHWSLQYNILAPAASPKLTVFSPTLFLQYFVDTAQIEAETHQPLSVLGGIIPVELGAVRNQIDSLPVHRNRSGLCGAYNPTDRCGPSRLGKQRPTRNQTEKAAAQLLFVVTLARKSIDSFFLRRSNGHGNGPPVASPFPGWSRSRRGWLLEKIVTK
ncbi:hypothetical protein B0H13DRAFT_1909182 [Mycena leptocephala]|nr:hypothetical protein B0H13DRAFT_1909182 [Mycena leptocephala]